MQFVIMILQCALGDKLTMFRDCKEDCLGYLVAGSIWCLTEWIMNG